MILLALWSAGVHAVVRCGPPIAQGALASRSLRIYDLKYDGGLYTAVVIQPGGGRHEVGIHGLDASLTIALQSEGNSPERYFPHTGSNAMARPAHHARVLLDTTGESYFLAESILQQANLWLPDFYAEQGLFALDHDGSMRRTFLESESLLKGESSVILIAEHSPWKKGEPFKLGKILTMSRLVTLKTDDERAPMEERVWGTPQQGMVARLAPDIRERTELVWRYPAGILGPRDILDPVRAELPLAFGEVKNRWWYFATAEWKNLVRVKHINLLDAMFTLAVAHGFTLRTGQPIPPNDPRTAELESRTAGGIRMWAGPESEMAARIGQFIIECDGVERRNYYLRRGFRQVRQFENPQMKGSITFWMVATVEEMTNTILPRYTGDLRQQDGMSVRLVAGNTIGIYDRNYLYILRAKVSIDR